jgi:hypothetical protein
MSKTRSNRLPKIIKVVLDVIYGMLIFTVAALVIWIAISPILVNRTDTLGTVSIPVSLGIGDLPKMEVSLQKESEFSINNLYVENARGILRLETTNPLLIIIANSSKLLIAIGLAYIVHQLRKIVKSVLVGSPFSGENIKAFRNLGYAVLVVGFGSGIVEGLAAWEILRLLPPTIPFFQAKATFDSRLVLGTALFIFLLVQIWIYGLELEREQALTI